MKLLCFTIFFKVKYYLFVQFQVWARGGQYTIFFGRCCWQRSYVDFLEIAGYNFLKPIFITTVYHDHYFKSEFGDEGMVILRLFDLKVNWSFLIIDLKNDSGVKITLRDDHIGWFFMKVLHLWSEQRYLCQMLNTRKYF